MTFLNKFLDNTPGSASKNFLISSVVWLVLGMAVGLLGATYFVWPRFIENLPQLQFGRIRPVHVNWVAFGFLSMGYVGSVFYMVPKLCKTNLFSERLGNFTMWAWNFAIGVGGLAIMWGFTEGREYAELAWPFDILVLAGLLMAGINVYMTVLHRKVKELYVSLWYFMGAFFWMPIVYIVGNRTFVSLSGLNDGIVNWFYGHNILGMWFTIIGVGMAYYVLPNAIKKPIYSHTLSLLGFFAIALFYAPTGTHHLEQAPVPVWLKVIAIVSSVFLLFPVSTVLVNFYESMRGSWHKFSLDDNFPLKFVLTGAVAYMFTCIQGPFQATRFINWYLHFSQWVVGHAHLALLGTFAFFTWASMYYIVPRLVGRPWYSRGLCYGHYWLSTIGFYMMLISLTIAGLVQAAGWYAGYPIQQWHSMMYPMMVVRWVSGILLLTAQFMFAYNFFKTVFGDSNQKIQPVHVKE
jgi:cytochrome c oxidase cbb3-type subunit 1